MCESTHQLISYLTFHLSVFTTDGLALHKSWCMFKSPATDLGKFLVS